MKVVAYAHIFNHGDVTWCELGLYTYIYTHAGLSTAVAHNEQLG